MELAAGASVATLRSLLGKLSSLLTEEYALIRGVRGDIQYINDELASMQCFLSNLAISDEGHDDQTEGWMKQVRDVAYDIEDCIDDFAHKLDPDPGGNDWLTVIRRTLYEIRTWRIRRDVAAKIGELKERAQHVGDRRSRYGVPDPKPAKKKSHQGGATGYLAAEHQVATRQLIRIMQPVGVKEIPNLEKWMPVPGDESRKQRAVLSIVGFGGAGKTTIAMARYRELGPQFQCRAMVTVSQNADAEVVLRDILAQVKPKATNGEQQSRHGRRAVSENKIPVIGSILSRIKLPSRSPEDNAGTTGQDKLHQIKTELQTHLITNRYGTPVSLPLTFSISLSNVVLSSFIVFHTFYPPRTLNLNFNSSFRVVSFIITCFNWQVPTT
jgi:hypothetical protein